MYLLLCNNFKTMKKEIVVLVKSKEVIERLISKLNTVENVKEFYYEYIEMFVVDSETEFLDALKQL